MTVWLVGAAVEEARVESVAWVAEEMVDSVCPVVAELDAVRASVDEG